MGLEEGESLYFFTLILIIKQKIRSTLYFLNVERICLQSDITHLLGNVFLL